MWFQRVVRKKVPQRRGQAKTLRGLAFWPALCVSYRPSAKRRGGFPCPPPEEEHTVIFVGLARVPRASTRRKWFRDMTGEVPPRPLVRQLPSISLR